jgi:hypothetical protein
MKINKTNIKALLGITETTYDIQIDMLIPQLLDTICEYCRNDFLLYGRNGYVYDNKEMVATANTITLTTSIPLSAGDFIRLYGTDYNDGLYQVYSYSSGVITIESSKEMKAETITSGYIALIDFPSNIITVVCDYIKNNIVRDGTVKSEKIDDTSIDYFAPFNSSSFISHNSTLLNNYRKVFRQSFYEVLKVECVN